mmetsp:Transcript_18270/g.47743  ORF Transcript_18270/g.47743 Transcript_18270/m.47743 type:complete len:211 (+) Transcript_18270:2584-3216(+)
MRSTWRGRLPAAHRPWCARCVCTGFRCARAPWTCRTAGVGTRTDAARQLGAAAMTTPHLCALARPTDQWHPLSAVPAPGVFARAAGRSWAAPVLAQAFRFPPPRSLRPTAPPGGVRRANVSAWPLGGVSSEVRSGPREPPQLPWRRSPWLAATPTRCFCGRVPKRRPSPKTVARSPNHRVGTALRPRPVRRWCCPLRPWWRLCLCWSWLR